MMMMVVMMMIPNLTAGLSRILSAHAFKFLYLPMERKSKTVTPYSSSNNNHNSGSSSNNNNNNNNSSSSTNDGVDYTRTFMFKHWQSEYMNPRKQDLIIIIMVMMVIMMIMLMIVMMMMMVLVIPYQRSSTRHSPCTASPRDAYQEHRTCVEYPYRI